MTGIIQEVTDKILGLPMPQDKVFLTHEKFEEFVAAIKPQYIKTYGGLICSERASRDGYANVLYHGIAVCLELGAR